MEYEFIEKLNDIKYQIHSDLSWWGYIKRNGVPTLWDRMPSTTTSFIIIDSSSGNVKSNENIITNHISKELEDKFFYQSYNQFLKYLTEEEYAIINSRYFRNRSIILIAQEFNKSKNYITKIITSAIYKIAYQNPNIDFLDEDYDKLQILTCSNLKISNQWREGLIRAISYNRTFYKKRISLLPSIMQNKLNKRLNKEILTSNDRKLLLVALFFIAYTLPKNHPLYITKEIMENEYHIRVQSEGYLNEFYRNINKSSIIDEFPIHMMFKDEKNRRITFHFNNSSEMNVFLSNNKSLKLLFSQQYSDLTKEKNIL